MYPYMHLSFQNRVPEMGTQAKSCFPTELIISEPHLSLIWTNLQYRKISTLALGYSFIIWQTQHFTNQNLKQQGLLYLIFL